MYVWLLTHKILRDLKNVMPRERGTFHGKYIKARSSETSNHYIQ